MCHGHTKTGQKCQHIVKSDIYCLQHVSQQIGRGRDPRHLTRLSGVHTLYFYPNVLDRRILLFGEHHDFKGICSVPNEETYVVEDYIWDLAVNAPRSACLDLFIEASLYAISRPVFPHTAQPHSPLDVIRRKFESIELPSNLRVHQIDLRNYYDLTHGIYPDQFFLFDEIVSGMRLKTLPASTIK